MNEMIIGDAVIAKLVIGTDKIANAVKVTMGPRGRNVIIKDADGKPRVTKDGVSVAKEINLEDPYENMAASLIKEVALKTVSTVGDGTTTSIVIAQALVSSGAQVQNMTHFKAGIKQAEEEIVKKLRDSVVKVTSEKTLYSIARTSSNGDEDVAGVVSKVAFEVGTHGIIRVMKSDLGSTTTTVESGCSIERGLLSSGYINNPDTGSFECKAAYVMIINGKAEVWKHITPALVMAHKERKPLIIIAKEFSDDVMRNSLKNCMSGTSVVPLTAPGFNDVMRETLEDIAIYCGTKVMDPIELEDPSNILLGRVESVSISGDSSVLYSRATTDAVSARVGHITKLMGRAKTKYNQGILANRAINLAAKTAVISVGGSIEVETGELFDRYEDAVGAVMAAYRSGVLPGSGMALYKISTDRLLCDTPGDVENTLGYRTLYEAIKAPATQIYLNANLDIKEISKTTSFKDGLGINVATLGEVNLIDAGIIDPIEVTIAAVSSAVTVATLMLSTGCIIK